MSGTRESKDITRESEVVCAGAEDEELDVKDQNGP